MNKKADTGNLMFIIIIIGAIFLLVSVILEKESKENKCTNLCTEYNAEFVEYNSGGFGSDECWCKKDGEPLRVS